MAFAIVGFIAALVLAYGARAQDANGSVVGTWSTKSQRVITGPSFYNYTADSFFEPVLTGISYSFTEDGYYEEAYFRAVSNPTTPTCPSAMIQWQHGTYVQSSNSSMVLTPITSDGRQLVSDPCSATTSTLSRYSQVETFSIVEVYLDTFNNQMRMDIYEEDGTPMNPMWINNTTPQMCPTTTISPVASATATSASKVKRALEERSRSVLRDIVEPLAEKGFLNPDRWFWLGICITGIGSVLVFYA